MVWKSMLVWAIKKFIEWLSERESIQMTAQEARWASDVLAKMERASIKARVCGVVPLEKEN